MFEPGSAADSLSRAHFAVDQSLRAASISTPTAVELYEVS